MIIWKGLGFLGLLIPIIGGITMQLIMGDVGASAGLGYILGAIPVWYLGKKWNKERPQSKEEATLENPNTERVKHSLFWIDMEYWGLIIGVVGATLIFTNSIYDLGTDLTMATWGIAILAAAGHQIYQSRKEGEDQKELRPERTFVPEKKIVASPVKENISKPIPPNSQPSTTGLREVKQNLQQPKKFTPSDHSRFLPPSPIPPSNPENPEEESKRDDPESKKEETDLNRFFPQ